MYRFIFALALAALGGSADARTAHNPAAAHTATAPDPAAVAAGQQVFQRCSICHSVTPGSGSTIGPSLNGVVDRKAGSVAGYQYSKAMSGSGLVWTKANLDKFLTSPQTAVPGTKMPFMGLPKAEDRNNVIAYLTSTHK